MATTLAAQYIRMSTDKQDMSPLLQREAIAAYAKARDIEVVATYEDEGRSGVFLKNRPALQKLLLDVTQTKEFSVVLVYDVSRWGRFQDTDAAAYYEYHCRLHGAEVIYVAEMFGAEVNPITTMLKGMKRAMAAEYSRELSKKARAGQSMVLARGFQMGQLPPLGYRRCSVSADGHRRSPLLDGQRKLALTDRVEWVLGPQAEVELVRRMCELYARHGLSFADLRRLGELEGWRSYRGGPMTKATFTALLRNEVLIGNFVWGRRKYAKGLMEHEPTRQIGCLPRIIDDDTWAEIQRRAALEADKKRKTPEQIVVALKAARERSPLISSREMRLQGLPNIVSVNRWAGSWPDCLKEAGADIEEMKSALIERGKQRVRLGREYGQRLARDLKKKGYPVAFDGRFHMLVFDDLAVHLRVLWPTPGKLGRAWPMRRVSVNRIADVDVVVRMDDAGSPIDFFLAPSTDIDARFPRWLDEEVPRKLTRYWRASTTALFETLGDLSARH